MKSLLKYLREINQPRQRKNINEAIPISNETEILIPKKIKPTSVLGRISQVGLMSIGIATCGVILSPGEALANMGVTISFPQGQNNISGTQSTELTVTVRNGTFDPVSDVRVETLLDLDADLTVNPATATTDCANGTASISDGKLILDGATIEPQQACNIKVTLTAGRPSSPQTYEFTIAENSVTSSLAPPDGTNKDAGAVTLTVSTVKSLPGNNNINHGSIQGNNHSNPEVATITLNNTNPLHLTEYDFELN